MGKENKNFDKSQNGNDFIADVVGSASDKCTKCPECGCDKYVYKDELGTGYRVCASCTQEWWTDIDYDS